MRTTRWFTVALVPSLCVSAAAAAQTGGTTPDRAGMQMTAGSGVSALLTSVLGTRSASGMATVEGRTVRVTWTGDQPGSTRPWYVHRGTCTRDEGMIGAASAYRPITVDASGSGASTATLDVPLTAGNTYYVAVHGSATPATDPKANVIACGALTDGSMRMAQPSGQQAGTTSMASMQHGSMQHGSVQHGSMQTGTTQTGTPQMGTTQTGNAAAMDHSAMAMPSTPQSGTSMPGMPGMSGMRSTDSASASLMAIHMRMMADPVIRDRVMTDPVLQRMMAQMPTAGMTMPEAPSAPAAADPHSGHAAPAESVTKDTPAARRASGRASTPARSTPRAAGAATGGARSGQPAASAPATPADPHAGHTTPPPTARPSQARPSQAGPNQARPTPQRPTQQRPPTQQPAAPAPADPHAGHTMPARRPP